RYLTELNVASAQFVGDIFGHVTGPPFGGVEGDDADRMTVQAFHQVADQRLSISAFGVGLPPAASDPAELIQHEIGILVRRMGHNRWRGTHDTNSRNHTPHRLSAVAAGLNLKSA